ncbi:nitroreductase family deazaflavin-dependent oxidoreductase [Streptoalloteichus hindustanus]|uniref:Deazaflavin-dependent oxidoreductase, nitroreductase family n=1 Tax=Streptoalloteichus hindustanus TaxID=2017 RepID=A0A1M5EM22_STRHI|nr:nitroreductase family deazaflavin-dependent oxidoreductase [Streptoalloteichus hindustanus]SHF80348.1 deazaflavin-dependent oxidoreductase, nitroreductase family [Streptoalloteichus hindustanus]
MRKIPRWLARAPIPLFRAGLGILLGRRFVMVEHTGRKSGQARHVVLEVLLREPDAVVVASGYGRASQWLRNVEATPRVRLWWGRNRGVAGRAHVLAPEESRRRLDRYRHEHPGQARIVASALGLPELTSAEPLPEDIGRRVPLVRFEIT